MDLDLWDCLGRVKLVLQLHRTDSITCICTHPREEKRHLIAEEIRYIRLSTVNFANSIDPDEEVCLDLPCLLSILLPYFFGYKTQFFSFPNNPKNLDPSLRRI